MYRYLKPKQEYSDLYDRVTVDRCRLTEDLHKSHKTPEEVSKKASKKEMGAINRMVLHYDLLYRTGERYIKKEEAIQEWINRDTRKDEIYNTAQPIEGVRCFTCNSIVESTHKSLYDLSSDRKERVLFMYDCPQGHIPRRAFFDDGEEWRPKPKICPKCNSSLDSDDKRVKNKIITTEKCTQCGYKNTDELDLTPKKEIPDKNFEKDRVRFCLTKEKGEEYIEIKSQFQQMKEFADETKERDKNKDVYDKVAKIKKLTIVQLQKLMTPLLEKAGYINIEFEKPEIDRDVKVGFTVQDSNENRQEYYSRMQLKKLINESLKDTNWRLMSDGLHYKLGILTVRLRGYENEEDLLKLVKKA